jgi:MFS transporter, PHS family, inorganic phosphate transporter
MSLRSISWSFLLTQSGLGLNNTLILQQIGYAHGQNVYKIFFNQAVGNLIITCAGAIPGYWATVATVDTIGRKPIQIVGFVLLTAIFVVIGFAYHVLSGKALLALYVLAQFFFNFGPNATTFIVPGECYPTRYRSSAHGISAASGKIGAIIAQVLIGPLRTRGAGPGTSDSPWLNHVMQIYSAFMFAGIFTSLLIPETKRKTLEQLAGEVEGTPEFDPENVRSRDVEKTMLTKRNRHNEFDFFPG